MKKFLSILLGVFFAFGALADDVTKITSKTYVDTEIAKKQDIMPAVNANTVLTHTDTAGVVGQKAIYDATENYVGQETALVTAGTADSAIQMAIDGEFVCANAPACTLWAIQTQSSQQILPTGYTALEYIETNDGYSYIDTGITMSANFDLYFEAMLQKREAAVLIRTSSGSFQTGWYDDSRLYSIISNQYLSGGIRYGGLGNKFRVGVSPHRMLNYDGTERILERPYTPSGTLWLFGGAQQRIYSVELYDGNTLTLHCVPARRNSDNVLGMYDTVSNTFFTNANSTGTFTAGPDLNVYMPSGN